jgi:translation elongation factor EF-Tu-like GTPase
MVNANKRTHSFSKTSWCSKHCSFLNKEDQVDDKNLELVELEVRET